jgi:pimeloyl-ACP methyl ester carboxylesterase
MAAWFAWCMVSLSDLTNGRSWTSTRHRGRGGRLCRSSSFSTEDLGIRVLEMATVSSEGRSPRGGFLWRFPITGLSLPCAIPRFAGQRRRCALGAPACQKLGADPDRIVLAGHSAGAYNAAMLALDPRWLGVDREAIKGLIGLAGPYDSCPSAGQSLSGPLSV